MKKCCLFLQIFILITCVSLLFNGCAESDDVSNIPAIVTINTGLNSQKQSDNPASRATAPSDVAAITLTVSADDMTTINAEILTTSGELTLDVPAGTGRLFVVTADTPYIIYRGTAEKNLTAGEIATVPITMELYQTKTAAVTISPTFSPVTPANISSYTLTVTASDMTTISNASFTAGSSISVAAGADRQFELLAYTPSVTLRGEATVTLEGDQTYSPAFSMSLYETKLVIPDYQNDRLVQVDGMGNPGWTTNDLGLGIEFHPYDVDFDSIGRIYIAYNRDDTGGARIYRIDDISDTSGEVIIPGDGGFTAVAADRNNNFIYYASSSALYKYDGSSSATLDTTTDSITSIRGLAIDENGLLIIAYSNIIAVYSPTTERVLDSKTYSDTGYEEAWDVMVKTSDIYGTIYDDFVLENNKIIQFSFDTGTNTLTEVSAYSISLYGPRRFIAPLDTTIYFIDEDKNSNDRIVSINNISGTVRDNYGQNGVIADGAGFFDFFLLTTAF